MALHGSPSPEALLDGVIAALGDRVAPEVTDPVVAEQLGFAITLLRYLRDHWDTASSDLLEEIAGLEALLSASEEAPTELRITAPEDLRYGALVQRANALHDRLVEAAGAAAAADDGDDKGERIAAALRALNERRG
jgi:hypothetical protein